MDEAGPPPAANDNEPPKERIGLLTAFFLVAVAIGLDALQFFVTFLFVIPVVGLVIAFVVPFLITLVAFVGFGIWFTLLRVNYLNIKMMGSYVAEATPFLEAVPCITGGVIMMIIDTHYQDKKAREEHEKKMGAMRTASAARLVKGIPFPPARAAAALAGAASIQQRQQRQTTREPDAPQGGKNVIDLRRKQEEKRTQEEERRAWAGVYKLPANENLRPYGSAQPKEHTQPRRA